MKKNFLALLLVIAMVVPAAVQAAEIITREDIIQKTIVEDQFVKMADNFIVLFDTSASMGENWKKGATKSKLDIAKEILQNADSRIPDLGYNAGLYTFSPFKTVYPMGSFDTQKYSRAIDSLTTTASGNTFLPKALRDLEPVLKGLSGKTVVFIFNDGTFSDFGGLKEPEDYTQEFADKYNVCFYMIGQPTTYPAKKRLQDMAKANACSRFIPFEQFVNNPQYTTGALYTVRANERVVTVTETSIAGVKINDVRFGFNSAIVESQYYDELSELGKFLQSHPDTFVLLVGYTDSIGSEDYNLALAQHRAESAAAYLGENFSIAPDRIVTNWYGEANPVADNATAEGRAQNRRVEIAVGGL
jgi:OOP family OmpA-OmpF porin